MIEKSSDELLMEMQASKKKNRAKLSVYGATDDDILSSHSTESKASGLKDLTQHLKMDEVELKLLLEEFKKASDENGLLDKDHFFRVAMNTLVHKFDHNALPAFHRIYEAFDLDGNGAIDFVELATGMSNLLYGDEKDILKLVFGLIDINNDGCVEQEELLDFFRKFFSKYLTKSLNSNHYAIVGQAKMNGYKLTSSRWKNLEEYLKRTFKATDLDNNGTVDFEEFIKAVEDPDSPLGMLFLFFHSNQL
ncbi:hypothetical protein ABK040_011485 [Willaertia magna]